MKVFEKKVVDSWQIMYKSVLNWVCMETYFSISSFLVRIILCLTFRDDCLVSLLSLTDLYI